MKYRRAKCLDTLLKQLEELYPDRSTRSDGWIGDAAHRKRKSDHNPNSKGVVRAIDVTHDPANGLDGAWLAAALMRSKDKRLTYIIWNRRISIQGLLGWKPYTGVNAHSHHVHISVSKDPKLYDSEEKWDLATSIDPPVAPPRQDASRDLKFGDTGPDVERLQQRLVELKYLETKVLGYFRIKTLAAVKHFQRDHGLTVDGIVGSKTKEKLKL